MTNIKAPYDSHQSDGMTSKWLVMAYLKEYRMTDFRRISGMVSDIPCR
jgi:hypothetical protein